ncbi:uncharacterized protein EI97DRAFT_454816 [Westerdykella ornata]|uniref:F-box domain-containing protein n=1 Tax=Westerdykella ornata TaxID=318751 RepID=A0A6A6JU16_WESOR|nr:uncharacterized protein EI97DRAFT_454816 [Westerdykella ornata]KAF2279867.1 hypothetical protein EI97DRAFT_454816 [Westerdykella ornata]
MPQPDCPLLSLPSEVRQMIWQYVFEYDDQDTNRLSSEQLALLATCRLINFEAIHLALQNTNFQLTCPASKSLSYRNGLRHLGPLQLHLRYITITMPIEKINCGPNNPFLLTQLPLTKLTIILTDNVSYSQRQGPHAASFDLRYQLVSALLYRSPPSTTQTVEGGISTVTLQGDTTEIYLSRLQSLARTVSVKTWNFAPTKDMLYDVMAHCRAHDVEVRYQNTHISDSSTTYWLWRALTHFQLVDSRIKILRFRGVAGLLGGADGAMAVRETEASRQKERLFGWVFYNRGNCEVMRIAEAKELGYRASDEA